MGLLLERRRLGRITLNNAINSRFFIGGAILCLILAGLFFVGAYKSSLSDIVRQGEGCDGYKIKNNKLYLYDDEIIDADLKSFMCIRDEYSKDKYHVFLGRKVASDADPDTFVVLSNGYAKDKDTVYFDYYSGEVINGADSASFAVFEDLAFSKDKGHVYLQYEIGKIKILDRADPLTFKQFGTTKCFMDGKHLYSINGDILADIEIGKEDLFLDSCGFNN